MGGQVGVLPVPARPAADPAVAADSAGARKCTPRAHIFGCIWKYLRGFCLPSAPPRRAYCAWGGAGAGCSGSGSRQRTASPPRPGHSLWGYMQPILALASVEVAQTAGGCDSRRRARQEKPGPPARSRRSTAGSHVWFWNHRTSPPPPSPGRLGGGPARGEVPAATVICGQQAEQARPLHSFTKQAPDVTRSIALAAWLPASRSTCAS
jgi:hypothetical protein